MQLGFRENAFSFLIASQSPMQLLPLVHVPNFPAGLTHVSGRTQHDPVGRPARHWLTCRLQRRPSLHFCAGVQVTPPPAPFGHSVLLFALTPARAAVFSFQYVTLSQPQIGFWTPEVAGFAAQ